jgi:hypothetical protein
MEAPFRRCRKTERISRVTIKVYVPGVELQQKTPRIGKKRGISRIPEGISLPFSGGTINEGILEICDHKLKFTDT